MTELLIAVVGAGAAGALVAPRGSPLRTAGRLRRTTRTTPVAGRMPPSRPTGGRAGPDPARRRVLASGAAALGVAVVFGAVGLVLAPVVGAAAWVLLGRLEPQGRRRRREDVLVALPNAADLLLACAEAGAPPRAALRVVGESVEGALRDVLRAASTSVELGASFADVAVTWRQDPALVPLVPLGDALARSESDGSSLTRALRQVSDDLRADRGHRVAAAARRAGVHAAAPLGLCFLPAFILVGIAPVLVAAAT